MTHAVGTLDRHALALNKSHFKEEAQRRRIILSFRITERESHLLAEAARLGGCDVTDVVRLRLFGPLPPLWEPDA